MLPFKEKIEARFGKIAYWLYLNPLKILPIIFMIIGFFCFQLPRLTIDTSMEKVLKKDDPNLQQYNSFREQFGRAELIIIAIESSAIFEKNFLLRLKSFHMDLENEVPYLRKVTSLINARSTHADDDTLIVEELLGNWPERSVDLLELKKRVLNNPFYQNYIISDHALVTAVVIETIATIEDPLDDEQILDGFEIDSSDNRSSGKTIRYFSEKENREVVDAVNRVVNRFQDDNFRIIASGGPIIVDAFNRETLKNVRMYVVLSLLTVAVFLWVLFNRVLGVVLPMVIINCILISTFGTMALFDVPVKLTTSAIPAFLLVVGVCDSMHILAIFYRQIEQGDSKRDAISFAYRHSGLAIALTSLTTLCGLLSFSFAELSAIAEIGYFAGVGVMMAFFYTVVMIPSIISLTPVKRRLTKGFRISLFEKALKALGDFSTRHPRMIVFISLVISSIFLSAIFSLRFSHNIVEYFPDDMHYKSDLKYVEKELKGILALEIVIDTDRANGILEPWLLNRIEESARRIENIKGKDISVGKVLSINDVLKEINKAVNENQEKFYRIPQKRNLIAQEFLLFESSGADDLEKVVDRRFQKTRMTIKTSWVDSVVCKEFIQNIRKLFTNLFRDEIDVLPTGLLAIFARTITAAIYSMAKSYFIAFLAIMIIIILLLRDARSGLISMIPNVIPIVITMGFMSFLNIALDINSLMIGSIALGIVVDDTVHLMYNFQKNNNKYGDCVYAIKRTLLDVGHVLVMTSLLLCSGFFILMCSSLKHMHSFGLFTGVTIITALIADLVLVPALITLFNPKRFIDR